MAEHFKKWVEDFAMGFLAIIILLALVQIGELLWFGSYGIHLKATAVSFSMERLGDKGRLLIVGDSTGVGVGAEKPRESVAGLLYDEGFSVVNESEWGVLTHEVVNQIKRHEGEYFDGIFIFTGGNDILWLARLNKTVREFEELIKLAKSRADLVVVMPPGNVGSAPLFYDPVGLIYTNRTRFVREHFMNISEREGVVYVDLFSDNFKDLTGGEPNYFFADDLIHPNSEGYYLWFMKMKEVLRRQGIGLLG